MSASTPFDLKTLNTFGVQAWADHCHVIDSVETAQQCLHHHGPPDLILSGGSNILLVKENLGRVWINRIQGRSILARDANKVHVRLNAGEIWDEAVHWTLQQDAFGLENLSLIPGCCGAAPIQNIGAYGVELSQFLNSVELLRLDTGMRLQLKNVDCEFSYRFSRFKNEQHFPYLITAINLDLLSQPQLNIEYPALASELSNTPSAALTAEHVRQAVISIRSRKLPNPKQIGNAGSFFKNPVITSNRFNELVKQFPQIPHWLQSDGCVKLSAAWLIEQCGLKGYRQGDAGVHTEHALVLVNHGHASGQEILALSHHIQTTVATSAGITLETEPKIICE